MTLTFDEKKHIYYLDGKKLTGVTTILGVIAKPNLIPWAAKEACKYIRENCDQDDDKFIVRESDLKLAEKAHSTKKMDAASKGTDVHALIEDYIKNGNISEEPMFHLFKQWAETEVSEFLETEVRLYHQTLFYAGTVDLVYKDKEGRTWFADIKTTSGIYDRTPFFQMAGYQHAFESMGKYPEVYGRKVIRIGKDLAFETKDSFDYATDLQGFLSALSLYRALNTF